MCYFLYQSEPVENHRHKNLFSSVIWNFSNNTVGRGGQWSEITLIWIVKTEKNIGWLDTNWKEKIIKITWEKNFSAENFDQFSSIKSRIEFVKVLLSKKNQTFVQFSLFNQNFITNDSLNSKNSPRLSPCWLYSVLGPLNQLLFPTPTSTSEYFTKQKIKWPWLSIEMRYLQFFILLFLMSFDDLIKKRMRENENLWKKYCNNSGNNNVIYYFQMVHIFFYLFWRPSNIVNVL